MPKLIYSMTMSADGYIAGPDGSFAWSEPDEELHRFHGDRVRELGVAVLGRRLYETMVSWETADDDPGAPAFARDFAAVWQALPKVVVSDSLQSVVGNTRLVRRAALADELAALRASHDRDIEIGGATIAGEATRLGLIDEYRIFVCPVAVGGGTPYFPQGLGHQLDLELVETRTFNSRVVYLRYRSATDESSARSES